MKTIQTDSDVVRGLCCLSTAHISKATAEAMDNDSSDWAFDKLYYGYLVWVEQFKENNQIPEDLKTALAYANNRGCDYLYLDCDGSVVLGLPTFNW